MADNLTSPKGMNKPNEPKAGLGAKDVGMVTNGVSLETGYKVLGHPGSSPQAVAQNTHGKTPGAKGSY